MKMKPISPPREFDEASISAHQFSVRSFSNQADSDEQEEINLKSQLIDEKVKSYTRNEKDEYQIDIYDMNPYSRSVRKNTNTGFPN